VCLSQYKDLGNNLGDHGTLSYVFADIFPILGQYDLGKGLKGLTRFLSLALGQSTHKE